MGKEIMLHSSTLCCVVSALAIAQDRFLQSLLASYLEEFLLCLPKPLHWFCILIVFGPSENPYAILCLFHFQREGLYQVHSCITLCNSNNALTRKSLNNQQIWSAL